MTLSVDAASLIAGAASGTAISGAHTCTGTNRYLVVGIDAWRSSAAPTFSNVQYAGVAMTELVTNATGDTNQRRISLYGLQAPASGANNVTATLSASSEHAVFAVSFASDTNLIEVSGATSAVGDSATPSRTVVSAAGSIVVDVMGAFITPAEATVGANQTRRIHNTPQAARDSGGMSTEPGAASITMSWTINSGTWSIAAVSVDEGALSGGTTTRRYSLTLGGVG